jgi:hypothetical protein
MPGTSTRPPLAEIIPDESEIRARLERCELEAALLRRLLRLALTRRREAERVGEGGGDAA